MHPVEPRECRSCRLPLRPHGPAPATSRHERAVLTDEIAVEGQHHFTYCCRSISDVSRYAKVSNWAHRLIRQLAPGPYTFVLPATSKVPRNHRNKRPATIGIRIPEHEVVQAILDTIDEPILSSSLIVPGMEDEIFDQEDLYDAVHHDVDLFVDAGYCPLEPTTLLDLTGAEPVVLREGQGVVDF